MLTFYRKPAFSEAECGLFQRKAKEVLGIDIRNLVTEFCYYVHALADLSAPEINRLTWLMGRTRRPTDFNGQSFISDRPGKIEVGPRMNFETFSSTMRVLVCKYCDLPNVARIERAWRVGLDQDLKQDQVERILAAMPFNLYDQMTQTQYLRPLTTFETDQKPEPVKTVRLIEEGMPALERINIAEGLAMDEQDRKVWFDLFAKFLGRNPTDVELFTLGALNSEHCRHLYFIAKLVIDGKPVPDSLMKIIKAPWVANPGRAKIAFGDNSSAIFGFEIHRLLTADPTKCSPLQLRRGLYHLICKFETHNHPSRIEPWNGAGTGIGGVIRDLMTAGRVSEAIALAAGYGIGNLNIPGFIQPWEDPNWKHPPDGSSALEILHVGSDGAAGYCNPIGLPLIVGWLNTCGISMPDGQRYEWFKPVVHVGGVGIINDENVKKEEPKKGMYLVRMGGKDYRVGIGGGSASSLTAGANDAKNDFASVQRAGPVMEQMLIDLFSGCVALGKDNPFATVQDMGAAGNLNALIELLEKVGGKVFINRLLSGDPTMSVKERWGCEAQEKAAAVVYEDKFAVLKQMADRLGLDCEIVGIVTCDGWIILCDENNGTTPVNLPLKNILTAIPPKTFSMQTLEEKREPLKLPPGLTMRDALERVLRLPRVASKRFLAIKGDASVGGCVAQQQNVGPNQITLCDYGLAAMSHFDKKGIVLTLGEQATIGLISTEAMVRMAAVEALLNMAGVKFTGIGDIDCQANWMCAAKLPGEGVKLYRAACALRDILIALGYRADGGKDSLSMAANVRSPQGQMVTVKGPCQLVVSNYAPVEDITRKVTLDIKKSSSHLLFLDFANDKRRLGGSALAQVYSQVGDEAPDIDDVGLVKRGMETVQQMLDEELVLAVHDKSDGLIIALLEMAFAGNKGLIINAGNDNDYLGLYFNAEAGLVIECERLDAVIDLLNKNSIPYKYVGCAADPSENPPEILVMGDENNIILKDKMTVLRAIWEETGMRGELAMHKVNPECLKEEARVNESLLTSPPYKLTFKPEEPLSVEKISAIPADAPKVAIFQAPGSNGHVEMASAFELAGFNALKLNIRDLITGTASLDEFQGLAPVGGFSFQDVFGAGVGWAGASLFNKKVAEQFERFFKRTDTFSFAPCNGFQYMNLIGRLPFSGLSEQNQPRLVENRSGRFERRFSTVKILKSPAIMLEGMEGSILGVHVSHGEGQAEFPNRTILQQMLHEDLCPIRFVDQYGEITEQYPFNPNGSPLGITAWCTRNGRHLGLMPHPERCFLPWQWHFWPPEWVDITASPWFKIFRNAYLWCIRNRN